MANGKMRAMREMAVAETSGGRKTVWVVSNSTTDIYKQGKLHETVSTDSLFKGMGEVPEVPEGYWSRYPTATTACTSER
jgi:hypothetical protein